MQNDEIRNHKGRRIQCRIARHLPLNLQGIWNAVEGFARAATRAKKGETAQLYVSIPVLADACACSLNTARKAIRYFIDHGMLIPIEGMERSDSGRWRPREFDLVSHQHYKQTHPCPEYRFCNRNGNMLVKKDLRRTDAQVSERFGRKRITDPDLVHKVLFWRDNLKKTFEEIGNAFGISKGSANKIYHRYKNRNYEITNLRIKEMAV